MKTIRIVVIKRNSEEVDFEVQDLVILDKDEDKVFGEILQSRGFEKLN